MNETRRHVQVRVKTVSLGLFLAEKQWLGSAYA